MFKTGVKSEAKMSYKIIRKDGTVEYGKRNFALKQIDKLKKLKNK